MYRQHSLNGFELQDQDVIDQKIEAQRLLENEALVFERHANFSDKRNVSKLALPAQTFTIDFFEQPRSFDPMDFDRCANNELAPCISPL